MSYRISVSLEAQEDLRGIYAYIAFHLLAPKNAKEQLSRLEKAIKSLSEFPMRHRLVDESLWKKRNLHVMPCNNFLVFYFVQEKKNTVIISRVLYQRRNLKTALE